MTRHGTLAYYLAAWVCGCFFMSSAIFLRFALDPHRDIPLSLRGAIANFWLFTFVGLIFGVGISLAGSFLMRRLMNAFRIAFHGRVGNLRRNPGARSCSRVRLHRPRPPIVHIKNRLSLSIRIRPSRHRNPRCRLVANNPSRRPSRPSPLPCRSRLRPPTNSAAKVAPASLPASYEQKCRHIQKSRTAQSTRHIQSSAGVPPALTIEQQATSQNCARRNPHANPTTPREFQSSFRSCSTLSSASRSMLRRIFG